MTRILLLVWLLSSSGAWAETRRVAVIVGHNAGSGERPPLRYAESDAGKLARVLVELGGLEESNVFLLQGRSLAELTRAMHLARERMARLRDGPSVRVVLLFYFSGHSDGVALELGRERLEFSRLQDWLASSEAEVRLAIVDSCKSGALLKAKGGTRGPAFDIRMVDELSSAGQAFLSSSAADELSHESRELRGSIFTHHLVSGLRGAADRSGDGLVTLSEVYQHAYTHTVSTTAMTLVGPQHPVYDYRLSGQGELVLTELSGATGVLELPEDFERALIVQPRSDQVLVELPPGTARRVAVPPGEYSVLAWRGGAAQGGRVRVAVRETRRVRWEELAVRASAPLQAKGAAAELEEQAVGAPLALRVAVGAQPGVTRSAGVLGGVQLGVRTPRGSGPAASLQFAYGRAAASDEFSAIAALGWRWSWDVGRLWLEAGLDAHLGLLGQQVDTQLTGWSATAGAAPGLGVRLPVLRTVEFGLEAQLPVLLLRKDGALTPALLPAAWLGVHLHL